VSDALLQIAIVLLTFAASGIAPTLAVLRLIPPERERDRRDAVVFLSFSGPCFIALLMGYAMIFRRGRPAQEGAIIALLALCAMCVFGRTRVRDLVSTWRGVIAETASQMSGAGRIFVAVIGVLVLLQTAQSSLLPIIEHDASKALGTARIIYAHSDIVPACIMISDPETNFNNYGLPPGLPVLFAWIFTGQGNDRETFACRFVSSYFHIAFLACLAWAMTSMRRGRAAASVAVLTVMLCPFYMDQVSTNQKEPVQMLCVLGAVYFAFCKQDEIFGALEKFDVDVWLAGLFLGMAVIFTRASLLPCFAVPAAAVICRRGSPAARIMQGGGIFLVMLATGGAQELFFGRSWIGAHWPVPPERENVWIAIELKNLGIHTVRDYWLKGTLGWLTRFPDASIPFILWLAGALVVTATRARDRSFLALSALSAMVLSFIMGPQTALMSSTMNMRQPYAVNVKYALLVLPSVAMACGLAGGEIMDRIGSRARVSLIGGATLAVMFMALATPLWGWKCGTAMPAMSGRVRLRQDLESRHNATRFAISNLDPSHTLLALDWPRYAAALPRTRILRTDDRAVRPLFRPRDVAQALFIMQELGIRYVQVDRFYFDVGEPLLLKPDKTYTVFTKAILFYGKTLYDKGGVTIFEIPETDGGKGHRDGAPPPDPGGRLR